ncbi:MAG: hypothetical protein WDZ41_03890 [Candidatus Babeliales bacterium]
MLNNIQVFGMLLWRDLYILKKRFKDDLINAGVMVFFFNLIFGLFGPLIGLTKDLVADTFMGTIVGTFLFIGFSRALDDLSDIKFNHFIDYRRTLPISLPWFFGEYIAIYVIHCMCITIPIFLLGKLILGVRLDFSHIQWLPFIIMYLFSMITVSLFFICLIFSVSFEWFKFNIWQRILTPLHQFGCLLYSWKRAYLFSPKIAMVLLLNPLTHCNEGLRTAMRGVSEYLSVYVSITFLSIFIGIEIFMLLTVVRKKLDWV